MLFLDCDLGNRPSLLYGLITFKTLTPAHFRFCSLLSFTVFCSFSGCPIVKYIFMTCGLFKVVGRNVVSKSFEPEAHVYSAICPICVDFRKRGKPEYPEKNPQSTGKIDCENCYHTKIKHTLLGVAFSVVRDITASATSIIHGKLQYLSKNAFSLRFTACKHTKNIKI